jgi:serine/threonine protein kinase
MSPADRDALLETLFHRALDADASQREAILDGADPELATELRELLAAHGDAPSCLEHASWTAEVWMGADEAAPGEKIGPYELLGLLGEGGMGTVHRARQTEPFTREVALKLVKPGMDTREVLARFESERRLLARLSHPHIAAVHDAGVTPMGRPYFVMELVDGQSITRFCDRRRLPLEDRLRLFITVCSAVQHAHQKGVVHRDIKPGNVLVSDQDGQAVPKVIDFGVGKALEGDTRRGTLCTRQGQLIGTPGYMSPEQAEGNGGTVDTRSDVYSLGVLLYELVTGALPVDVADLRGAGDTAVRRRLSEAEPLRPSARLTTLDNPARRRRAVRRQLDPKTHRRALAGDLDWISMKAIAGDPSERYASASELAADVVAHLEGAPVTASPPALPFRLARLAVRHRVPAAAAVLLALVAIAGPSLVAWNQGGKLAELEQRLGDGQERELPPAPGDRPAPAGDASCADCLSTARLSSAADLVLVRNVGHRALAPGEVLEVVSESSLGEQPVFDVTPAVQGSQRALLGATLRSVQLEDDHLHALADAVAPGGLAQAAARGALVRVAVDGPVSAHTPLGPSSRSGVATTAEGAGPVLGTVQSGWNGPGPGFVRATIDPQWPRPVAAADPVLGGGSRSPVAPTPGSLGVQPGAGGSPALEHSDDGSWGVGDEGVEPELPGHAVTIDSRKSGSPWGPPLALLPKAPKLGGSDDADLLGMRSDPRRDPPEVLPKDDLGDGGDLGLNGMSGELSPGLAMHWIDHDGDGLEDLLALRHGTLTLLRNMGQGLFADVTERLSIPTNVDVVKVVAEDFDLDKRTDLVLLTSDGMLRVLLCRGSGMLDGTPGSGVSTIDMLETLEAAEPDQDGLVHLLATTTDGTLLLLLNDGSARFEVVVLAVAATSDDGASAGNEPAQPETPNQGLTLQG